MSCSSRTRKPRGVLPDPKAVALHCINYKCVAFLTRYKIHFHFRRQWKKMKGQTENNPLSILNRSSKAGEFWLPFLPPFLKVLRPNLFFFSLKFYWRIVDTQSCVHFFWTSKWFRYIDSLICILFHDGVSQATEQLPVRCGRTPLFILPLCVYRSASSNPKPPVHPSLSSPPPWQPWVCSPHLGELNLIYWLLGTWRFLH